MQILNVFKGKKVLVTGHTGFKGSWLSIWLRQLGAEVYGLSKDVPSKPSHFNASRISDLVEDNRCDVCNFDSVSTLVHKIQPDFVFHLAAQALVRASYENPLETLSTNAIGTVNILESLKALNKKVVAVMITSDKVYDNLEWAWGYKEIDKIGGKDPYSASKGMAELAIRSYVESFYKNKNSNISLGIARAGNVIGGGDWANDRIVPDCMQAWSLAKTVDVRNPYSTRPWQHVLEPLSGYLSLGYFLSKDNQFNGEAYNFGPLASKNYSVSELIEEMSKTWKNVRWNDVSEDNKNFHEAGLLKLNCDKANFDLNWLPSLTFEETVRMTVEWYKTFYQSDSNYSMSDFTINQISEYTSIAASRSSVWAK
jgi:CDP-glucose 4,6-dehydratase